MLDGRIARASNSGSRFGAELDSLVDVISFGVAPALLMYFLEFSTAGRLAWVICFFYVACAALRLARFNVLAGQGGKPQQGAARRHLQSTRFTSRPGTMTIFFGAAPLLNFR